MAAQKDCIQTLSVYVVWYKGTVFHRGSRIVATTDTVVKPLHALILSTWLVDESDTGVWLK